MGIYSKYASTSSNSSYCNCFICIICIMELGFYIILISNLISFNLQIYNRGKILFPIYASVSKYFSKKLTKKIFTKFITKSHGIGKQKIHPVAILFKDFVHLGIDLLRSFFCFLFYGEIVNTISSGLGKQKHYLEVCR